MHCTSTLAFHDVVKALPNNCGHVQRARTGATSSRLERKSRRVIGPQLKKWWPLEEGTFKDGRLTTHIS